MKAVSSSPALRAVILDCDDTLFLTEEACFQIENAAAGKMGCAPMTRETHQHSWGRTIREAAALRFPGIDVDHFISTYELLLGEWVRSGRIDQLLPENLAALDRLKAQGYALAVLTSRKHSEVAHLLDPAHELSRRLSEFHYFESSPFLKPDPRVFDALLAKLGVKPAEAVYVGDAVSDAQAAGAAGVRFVASLESGLRTPADFSSFPVASFIRRFSELPDAVRRITPGG